MSSEQLNGEGLEIAQDLFNVILCFTGQPVRGSFEVTGTAIIGGEG